VFIGGELRLEIRNDLVRVLPHVVCRFMGVGMGNGEGKGSKGVGYCREF
jgi:hypothetical protein